MRRVHEIELDIRWGDMDAVGHVNNATYLTYFEQARIGWLAALGGRLAFSEAQGPVMANVSCEFRRPIVHPARLRVEVLAGEPGRSSLPTAYRIVDAADPSIEYATGSSVLVWIDYRSGRPVPVPDAVRASLTR